MLSQSPNPWAICNSIIAAEVTSSEVDAADAPAWHVSSKLNNAQIGALLYFSVENVQQAYDEVVAGGLRPASEPIELRGNREFTLLDPDGYRLVFFKRK